MAVTATANIVGRAIGKGTPYVGRQLGFALVIEDEAPVRNVLGWKSFVTEKRQTLDPAPHLCVICELCELCLMLPSNASFRWRAGDFCERVPRRGLSAAAQGRDHSPWQM